FNEINALTVPVAEEERKSGIASHQKQNDNSFIYVDTSGDRDINLNQLHDKLADADKPFIKKPKDIRNFRKIFSGEKITKPVIWLGTNYELNFFVRLLLNKEKIQPCKKHFATAIKCFHDRDNQKFNYDSLRTATRKPPRAKLLESMVDTL